MVADEPAIFTKQKYNGYSVVNGDVYNADPYVNLHEIYIKCDIFKFF
jgi:hypothetical protein